MAGTFESQYLKVFNTGKTSLNKQKIPFQKRHTKTTCVFFATDQNVATCIVAFNGFFSLNNQCIA